MKVTWTARARTRLAEIHDYIAQDSKPRALAMVERIFDRADGLLIMSKTGSVPWRLAETTGSLPDPFALGNELPSS